jgi:hypothetical protein
MQGQAHTPQSELGSLRPRNQSTSADEIEAGYMTQFNLQGCGSQQSFDEESL